MKIKIFKEEERVWWDFLVFSVIVIATFEIPYELLVDIKDTRIELFFDYLFLVVFGTDIIINCISSHEIKNNGILGVRRLFPTVRYPKRSENNDVTGTLVVNRFPQTITAYLTSWWFVVDFLAVFPFELIFGAYSGFTLARTLRLARITRLLRIFRVVRAVKSVKAFHSLDKVFHLNPSLGRFVIICITVPWLLHVFACLLSYFESAPGGLGFTYAQSLEHLFVTFTTNNRAEFSTMGGKITATSAVIFGYLFFGLFMGNFASFFESIDAKKAMLDEKNQQWKLMFKSYPEIFDKMLQKKILLAVKKSIAEDIEDELSKLVQSLNANLETEVLDRLGKSNRYNP